MIARCHRETHEKYPQYGGRGITVCREWRESPEAFYKWALSNGYQPHLQIDRIANEKGYSPANCRWVTCTENQNNRRSNRRLSFRGEEKTLADWARARGLRYSRVLDRFHKGWPPERILEYSDNEAVQGGLDL